MVLLLVLVGMALLIGAVFTFLGNRGVDLLTSTLLIATITGLIFGAVLVPMGWSLDRSLAQIGSSIETIGVSISETDEESAAAQTDLQPVFSAPKWLLPITHAFTAAADRFHQREQALRNQMREIEIRHRVSEAERRQVEAVLHALRDPVVVTDAFNEIVMVNEAAVHALGFQKDEALHKPIEAVIRDQRLCKLIRDARDSANFSDSRHVEMEISRENPMSIKRAAARAAKSDTRGSEVAAQSGTVYDVTFTCIENHKGKVGGVVTILRDLTRERELSQMKTDFVSKASHELRTPLSSIRGYVEMLVDGEAGDEKSRHEFYRIMQDETERLGRLIDNMLNISRIEAGIVQIERENVDMKELVDRAVHTLKPQAEEKKISLNTKNAAVDLCVEGDADMLYQVVLNLISNAVKYTPEGGRITVSGDTDNLTRSVLITISDTGLGIPPDALPKLFDKFFRVENYKRVAKGTGLGLSLCKHIVETVHQGQIGVESKLGMGSRFWFAVPMRYAGSKAAA